MGNQPSSSRRGSKRSGSHRRSKSAAQDAKDALATLQEGLAAAAKNLDESGTASQLIDSVCGGSDYYDEPRSSSRRGRKTRRNNSDSDSEDDATYDDEGTYDDDTYTDGSRTYDSNKNRRHDDEGTIESGSYVTEYTEEDSYAKRRKGRRRGSYDSDPDDDSKSKEEANPTRGAQPLASSFAKRCYFTKAGIGKTSQHYEGLTLTGNVVLMLSSAMKLKGCPTICDEDLRRVEQTYPNQFSRLPDELLLSSGWRRISKYCHFSKKPIPDGVPFFHSKKRLHHSGGYFFLLASSVGMVRPSDVEPLTKDTLVLLETDFPNQCDNAPPTLIEDPNAWTLVDKFCFFSGGPINTEEDVYYQADFDGNPIYMLAFLSPSLTPEELYKIKHSSESGEPGLKSMKEIEEVESIYDLTERDFDDLKLYHLGPCRALPQYILQPTAWTKVLPPHFNAARNEAIARALKWQAQHGEGEEDEVSQRLKRELDQAEAKSLNMNAPDPDDPIVSPTSTFVAPDFQFAKGEPSPVVHSPVSNSFKEDEKKTDDEPEDKKMEDENDKTEQVVAETETPSAPQALDTSIDSLKSGEEDFTPIKREGYKLGSPTASNPTSPMSTGSTGSAAMRGAQELIRKKRAQRMEVSKRHSNSRPSSPTEDERDGNSSSPASKNSFGEVGPQGSLSSDESQIEKNSRRAMIVKMAKARMANNQQTSDDVSGSSSFPSVTQEGNSGNSWDVAADLD